MQKKYEINWTKIKGGCQSGRKVVTQDSKSDLLLVISIFVICFRQCNCGSKTTPKPRPTPSPTPNPANCVKGKICISDWQCGLGFCEIDTEKRFTSG